MTSRQTNDPLRSELTDQLRNNNQSLPSFKSEEYVSKISELSNIVKLLREKILAMEQRERSSEEDHFRSLEQEIAIVQVENSRLSRENKALKVRINDLEHKLKMTEKSELANVKSQGKFRTEMAKSMPEHFHGESSVKTTELLR